MTNTDKNINTEKYWENRFYSGDWETKGGRAQTVYFAAEQVRRLHLQREFDGVLVDFGCGLGDAIPVYREFFPYAKIVGIDVAESAIEKCKISYGSLANFFHGTHNECPNADIIISSNVFEHLSDDINIARDLLKRCRELYITVPYLESPLSLEHIRSYDENYFESLGKYKYIIFASQGWSEYGIPYIKLLVKNAVKTLLGRKTLMRRKQIMFVFQGDGAGSR